MGNTPSKDLENNRRNIILLDEGSINNFIKEDNHTCKHKTPEHKRCCKKFKEEKKQPYTNKSSENVEQSKEYERIRKEIVNNLIKESEEYITEQKGNLNLRNLNNKLITMNPVENKCAHDETKIYNCLKDMNDTTTTFVNTYHKCYQYLRKYEECVQKV